jgi:hypothetical protein
MANYCGFENDPDIENEDLTYQSKYRASIPNINASYRFCDIDEIRRKYDETLISPE